MAKLTSSEVMILINAIGDATSELLHEAGVTEYVAGFSIFVDYDKLRELLIDELTDEASVVLTDEVDTYLKALGAP